MKPEVEIALKGLSSVQLQEVMRATKQRATQAHKAYGIVDVIFIERCLIEYAEDIRLGRKLDQVGVVPVELMGRNYGEQYRSPRAL